jgi:hypothetical protein
MSIIHIRVNQFTLNPRNPIMASPAPALMLQQAYLDAGVVTPNWADDALHVALASVSECSVIVSWNFQHIVNLRRIPLYNAISAPSRGHRHGRCRTAARFL